MISMFILQGLNQGISLGYHKESTGKVEKGTVLQNPFKVLFLYVSNLD
jgi:hypothetical protein